MDKNLEMIDQIYDDLAHGKYGSVQEAVDALVYYGEDPMVALNSVLAMESIDVI
jgi:hypothetical protein